MSLTRPYTRKELFELKMSLKRDKRKASHIRREYRRNDLAEMKYQRELGQSIRDRYLTS